MSSLVPSRFQRYKFSEEEEIQGALLTTLQLEVIRNEQAIKAEEVLNLKLEEGKEKEFFQQQASLEGQISAYGYLIAKHEWAQDVMESRANNEDESKVPPPHYTDLN